MPHDYVLKNLIFDPYRPPNCDPQGMTRGHNQNSIQNVIHLSLLSICVKCGIKILKIVFVIEFYCYLLFDPSPGLLACPLGRNFNCLIFYSSSPFIWYASGLCSEKLNFWPLPTLPGHDPAVTTKIPIITEYMCKFGTKNFKIDFVIEFYYLTFWPLPRAPGGWTKNKCALACPTQDATNQIWLDSVQQFRRRCNIKLWKKVIQKVNPPARLDIAISQDGSF